jgi:hypothetical protein
MTKLSALEGQLGAMTAVSAEEIGCRLRSLHKTAAEHFELEEQGGDLSPDLTCTSDLDVKRRGLLEDHRFLLKAP